MADARSERHPAVRATPGQPEERHGHFVQEAWAELKKVEWPGQAQVIQGTVVVLVACVVVGTYLYLNDLVWKHVVSKVFLGQ
jgi:preprotein translocase SecE subunit